MKKLFIPALLAASLGMQSCKDDFQVASPYKEIMMAYGMINATDTAHYIRIEKAFLDNNKSAIDMSQIADSSYFKNLTVVMKEYDGTNNALRRVIPMYRVDMRLEAVSYTHLDVYKRQGIIISNIGLRATRSYGLPYLSMTLFLFS